LFAERTSPAPCMQCHTSLNGIGFGFERYNAAGHYQVSEQGLAIDARGTVSGGSINGGIELSNAVAASSVVHRCATERWLRYALARDLAEGEAPLLDKLAADFYASGGNVRSLLLGIVLSPSFRMQRGTP
jgi:hypothetical protein